MIHIVEFFRRLASLPLPRRLMWAVPVVVIVVIPIHSDRRQAADRPPVSEFTRHTDIGRRDAIALEDLTELHLNGDTSIHIRETLETRKLVLEKGEVLASVHHDEARPFEVVIKHALLFDLGTEFDAANHDNTTNVSVIGGELRVFEQKDNGERLDPFVETAAGSRRALTLLEVGDIARIEERSDGSVVVRVARGSADEVRARTSWLRGELNVTTESLDELVAQFNRYHVEHLTIENRRIAEMKAPAGHFFLSDLGAFLSNLPQWGLRADPLPQGAGVAAPQEYLITKKKGPQTPRDQHRGD